MPKKNHYDVLGVDKGATPDKIKRAYRKRAAQAHPDKGGSDAEMAEINRAWEVLSNPQMKLLYDATGEDQQKSIDEEVKNIILSAFNDALYHDAAECLKFARQAITKKSNEVKSGRSQAETAQKKLSTKRDKIKAKGENLFHLLIDQELSRIAAVIANCDRAIAICKAALLILDEYESSEKAPKTMTFEIRLGSFSTSTSGL